MPKRSGQLFHPLYLTLVEIFLLPLLSVLLNISKFREHNNPMASSAGARLMAASRRPVKPVGEIPTVQDLWDRDDLEAVETRFSYSKQANQRVSVWRGELL